MAFSELSAGDGGEGGPSAGEKCLKLQVTPSVGELMRPVSMTTNGFANEQKKLRGMNETIVNFEVKSFHVVWLLTTGDNILRIFTFYIELPQVPSARVDQSSLKTRVFEVANVAQVPSSDQEGSGEIQLKFAGRTTAGKNFVLITMKVCPNSLKASLTVNCEKIVVGSLLAKSIRQAIEN